jgi:hypothetical protein
MFDLAVDALADRGTLVVIGMMAAYSDGWKPSSHTGLAEKWARGGSGGARCAGGSGHLPLRSGRERGYAPPARPPALPRPPCLSSPVLSPRPALAPTLLPSRLLWKSARVAGFFLLRYAPLWR